MAYRRIALLVCALAALAPMRALACSCFPGDAAHFAKTADAIFRGRLTAFEGPGMFAFSGASRVMTARFEVITVWKGPAKAQLAVKTEIDSTACGVDFKPGEYLVFARQSEDGTLRTSTCSGTDPFREDSESLKYVKEHFTATDMTRAQATTPAPSSCSSTPGNSLLPALVLLACWLRRR